MESTYAMTNTKFTPGKSGNPATQFTPGNSHRWTKGVSGNPTGKSKYRVQFEEAFNEALITEGGPEEAARLLWEAARAKEPWAVQNICARFAPQTQSLTLTHEVTKDELDYSTLSNEQLAQLDALLHARDQPPTPEGGDGTPPVA
jgi:hypothetical protein